LTSEMGDKNAEIVRDAGRGSLERNGLEGIESWKICDIYMGE
jgi:hypothetical protein